MIGWMSVRAFFVLSFLMMGAAQPALAVTLSTQVGYYGEDFYKEVARGAKDKDLIAEIRTVLESRHQRTRSGVDVIGGNCDTAVTGCYQHRSIGYGAARKVLMGTLHLSNSAGKYTVKDVYCEREFTDANSGGIGPGKVPSANMLNTEHTWPQSRFNGSMGKDTQKSDLHHLFPTDSEMNSVRGNHKFGDVAVPDKPLKCPIVKIGRANGSSEEIFEPPVGHKGNVARALFYFSIRYRLAIDPREEAFLKAWHRMDPVDQAERDRNDAIQKVQGNRNPFIDHPELVGEIVDF